jgi:NADH dehydrogenase FAD-containing subunit
MKNIVILGGGYAGIFAAANLINKRGDVKIIIIDKNPYHQLYSRFISYQQISKFQKILL